MAWNKNENNEAASSSLQVRNGRRFPIRMTIAAVFAVACAAVVLWLFFSNSKATREQNANRKAQGLIREVTPAPAKRIALPVEVEKKPPITNGMSKAWRQYYDGRDTNKWTVVYNPATGKEYISRIVKVGRSDAKPPLYENRSLNILDAIAFKPIVSMMPNVQIDERFMQSFQQSLIETIEIDPDEPDDIKARKEQMIDLLADMRKQLKEGADLQQLIRESLAERNRVATLRRAMQFELARMYESGSPDDEQADFAAICNKKLRELGAIPIQTEKEINQQIEEQDALAAEAQMQKGQK